MRYAGSPILERHRIRHDLSILRSQTEFSNSGFGFHTHGGAMPEVLEPPVRSARELSNHGGPDRKALDGSKNVAIEASLAPVPLNQSRETMEPATITALASHRPSLERAQSSWRSAHDRLHAYRRQSGGGPRPVTPCRILGTLGRILLTTSESLAALCLVNADNTEFVRLFRKERRLQGRIYHRDKGAGRSGGKGVTIPDSPPRRTQWRAENLVPSLVGEDYGKRSLQIAPCLRSGA